jgi:hypothetical protein
MRSPKPAERGVAKDSERPRTDEIAGGKADLLFDLRARVANAGTAQGLLSRFS